MNPQISIYNQPNYENKNHYLLSPLMQSFLKKNGYKFPTHEEFRNYIFQYFTVDIDTCKYDDITLPQIDGDYVIIRDKLFISTLPGEQDIEKSKDELGEGGNKQNVRYLINFNKLIFNKTNESYSYFLNNDTLALRDIVIATGFYLNKSMLNIAINSIDQNDNDALGDIIFDIYKPEGKHLRKDILAVIAGYKIDLLINLIDHFPQNFSKYNKSFKQSEIDYIMAYVLYLELKYEKPNLVQYYLDEHSEYSNTLKKQNYYDFEELKEYVINQYSATSTDSL